MQDSCILIIKEFYRGVICLCHTANNLSVKIHDSTTPQIKSEQLNLLSTIAEGACAQWARLPTILLRRQRLAAALATTSSPDTRNSTSSRSIRPTDMLSEPALTKARSSARSEIRRDRRQLRGRCHAPCDLLRPGQRKELSLPDDRDDAAARTDRIHIQAAPGPPSTRQANG